MTNYYKVCRVCIVYSHFISGIFLLPYWFFFFLQKTKMETKDFILVYNHYTLYTLHTLYLGKNLKINFSINNINVFIQHTDRRFSKKNESPFGFL